MFHDLLRRITGLLDNAGIKYMISGSLALNLYYIPRMTMDVDIVIELDKNNLDNFLCLFRKGYYIDETTVKEETYNRGMFNVIDHQTGLKIDFILRKNTEYRRHEFSRRVQKIIDESPVYFVSPEDLVISKLEWIQQLRSDKQVNDILLLMSLPNIDKKYIYYWCKFLNLDTFGLIK